MMEMHKADAIFPLPSKSTSARGSSDARKKSDGGRATGTLSTDERQTQTEEKRKKVKPRQIWIRRSQGLLGYYYNVTKLR
jgi:hypothetical protein